jgi:hypothetical protein
MRTNRWAWAAAAAVVAVGGYMYWNRAHALSPQTRAVVRHDLDEARAYGDRAIEKAKDAGRDVAAGMNRKVRRSVLVNDHDLGSELTPQPLVMLPGVSRDRLSTLHRDTQDPTCMHWLGASMGTAWAPHRMGTWALRTWVGIAAMIL